MTQEEIKKIFSKLRKLERLLKVTTDIPVSMTKAIRYTGLSRSHLYKLTSGKMIPHYKPHGKMIFFRKSDLDQYLLANKIATHEELENKSIRIFSKLKR